MPKSQNVLYSETASGKTYGMLLLIASLVLCIVGFFLHVVLFLAGMIGFVVGLTWFSVGLYNKVVLTADTLQVGQHKLAITEIDPTFGVIPQEDHQAAGGDPVTSIFNPATRKGVRQVGGGYDQPAWMKVVIIRLKNGQTQAITSKNRDAFIAALRSAIKSSKSRKYAAPGGASIAPSYLVVIPIGVITRTLVKALRISGINRIFGGDYREGQECTIKSY